ncbi:MAG: class I SAM-dependent methyltransferase [Alphaproteobacteria bacterium]|nr:class I SAM-dependent methyltransferase [Alphaproteobacteria bacterium]
MLAQIASDKLFKRLDTIESGRLEVTTPDGKTRTFEGRTPGDNATIQLHDWRVISNMIRKGDIGFAEDYRAGKWETDNLTGLVTLGLANKKSLNSLVMGSSMSRVTAMLSYLLKINSVKGSKKNIHAHYDLGNDFYKLWLDPTMTYSSAIYKDKHESLTQAQHNKYDRILDCVDRESGSLLEIGCGWGGFAERAQQRGDFNIRGVTLSQEQHAFANNRLAGAAEIVLEDYRHQDKKYDNIVSIEMFEAVGEKYWPTYFAKVKELLSDNGKAVIQTITMNEDDFSNYRKGGDFIRSFIFPGGMLPSASRFKQEAAKAGLKTNNSFYFGQDYARTLSEWLNDFDKKHKEIQSLGFDDGFMRLWRFYLAACIAGFKTERTDVMQVELSHA